MRELPKYRSLRDVWAFKIANISPLPSGGAMLQPDEFGYAAAYVNQTYLDEQKPHIGGFYVLTDDACASFVPAAEFVLVYVPVGD